MCCTLFSWVDSSIILSICSFQENFSNQILEAFQLADKARYTVLKINFLKSANGLLFCGWLAYWSSFQLEMLIGSVTFGWQDILLKFTYKHILAQETVCLANRNNLSCAGPACQLPIHRPWNLIWGNLRNWNHVKSRLVIIFPSSSWMYYLLVKILSNNVL